MPSPAAALGGWQAEILKVIPYQTARVRRLFHRRKRKTIRQLARDPARNYAAAPDTPGEELATRRELGSFLPAI